MKKSSIALISSPVLLAAFLFSSASAQANPDSITISKDPHLYTTSVVITNLRIQNADQQNADQNIKPLDDRNDILMSDRIGDLAISKLGCDCMGCRQTVAQLFSK